ncbi:MAG TPA: DNA repair protein RecN [Rhodospirillales bacterium]|nr:DNA repair protein RecN [Rhodospirillales bacterium]
MLTGLSIRDILLIDRLDLEFAPGLTVLTGETGAGKSIILGALGFACGARAERRLVRGGARQGTVAATFAPPADHPLRAELEAQGIAAGEEIVLRRQLAADGRSRAWIEDVPVSGNLLRRCGTRLLAVHGQHASQGLLDPSMHRSLLDAYGGHASLLEEVATAFARWQEAQAALRLLEERLEATRCEEEDLRFRVAELADLAPEPGEEERLAERRRRLMHREKLASLLQEGLAATGTAVERLADARRIVARAANLGGESVARALEAADRALIEAGEVESALAEAARDLELDSDGLERVEERLFALRDAARKFRCAVDELPDRLAEWRRRLDELEGGAEEVERARTEAETARAAFTALAERLTRAREAAADRLAAAVEAELAPLRMERARFRVALEALDPARWNAGGAERVRFEVATNPGQPFGPLARIASGGELSRFMLALEVVVGGLDPVPSMIFDEVDAGVGGAVAAAVGERLRRLSAERQVIVVTHAPQIAALADHHLRVAKTVDEEGTRVTVETLDEEARREEIARMLAGVEVTEAARAAADSLLSPAGGATR